VALTEPLMIAHVYGFTPFSENCSDPTINLLEDNPGYADNNNAGFKVVKETFDDLQPGSADRNRTLAMNRLERIPVPAVPLHKQIEFSRLQTKVAAIHQMQGAGQSELDALLPAVLDKAFNGKR
jgi:hypothetical protein